MRRKVKKPPFLAEYLLGMIVEEEEREFICGDLKEFYLEMYCNKGWFRAGLWYYAQIYKSLPQFVSNSIWWSIVMINNYIKVAFRNITKRKGYSFINITGFAIGMACSIVIALYVSDEISYDTYHENADRLYRVGAEFGNPELIKIAYTSPPMAESFLNDFPEIKDIARLSTWGSSFLVKYEEKSFLEERFIYADSTIFKVFTIPFLHGAPETSLNEPFTIVITQKTAYKYFGDENPVGKSLKIGSPGQDYRIDGIVENCLEHSHIQYEGIISIVTSRNSSSDRWMSHNYFTYVLLRKNSPPDALEAKFPEFIKRHYGPQYFQDTGEQYDPGAIGEKKYYNYFLQPLTSIHLDTEVIDNSSIRVNKMYVYILSIISLFILIIACINFMNLSTARYARRAKEIGMRKVLGSVRTQLITQFIVESVIISMIALCGAVIIIKSALPVINNFSGKELYLDLFGSFDTLPALLGFAVVIGILAGSYPALFLSSMRPIRALKSSAGEKAGSRLSLRRGLVIFQFTISIAIILSAYTVYDQLNYMNTAELGFNKDQVLVIHRADALGDNQKLFRELLSGSSSVLTVSNTSSLPGRHFNPNDFRLEGSPATDRHILYTMFGDYCFDRLIDMELVEGRFFSNAIKSDTNAVVINETAVKKLGLTEPVGTRFFKEFDNAREGEFVTIVGVVKDINFMSLHSEIEPMLIRNLHKLDGFYTSVKIRPDDMNATISMIEDRWNELTGGQPFKYTFLDNDYNTLYGSEQKAGQMFAFFSFLAVLIACLGLFGLISFAAEQRTKEIGVRKVLGANILSIVYLLSKETILLVTVSILIASPLSYFALNRWLENFAYRIDMSPLVFIFTGLLTLGIALITISYQSVRAAISNPVDSLRYE